MLQEIARRVIPITKNEATDLSWKDSVLSVRTDKGMNFLEFSCNLNCLDKFIDMVEHAIPCPMHSPAEALCKSRFIRYEMPNYDYTEMLLDSSFWPHERSLKQEMTRVIMSRWSPSRFIDNKSVLAMLNNIGGVEVIIQQQYRWKTILNLSPYIQQNLKYEKNPTDFNQLKKSVYKLVTTSICWSSCLNSDGSCYFVTAQRNSMLLLWQIDKNLNILFKGKIDSKMAEIKNMLWLPSEGNKRWLICADVLGQVYALNIQIGDNSIELLHSSILWQHKDKMVASHLNHTIIDGKNLIFYSKHRHFVAQLLDNNYNILSQYFNNVTDYKIVDIKHSNEGFYLAAINVKVFKIKYSTAGDSLSVDLIPVEIKEQFSTYELYSMEFSSTNTLWTLALLDRQLMNRKKLLKLYIVFFITESKLNSLLENILNNPSQNFTSCWDCIELLRYRTQKTKTLPAINFKLLYKEGAENIFKLKVYLVLLTFYTKLRELAQISSDFELPEYSIDMVKEKILLLHAQSTMKRLYNKHKQDEALSILEEEILLGCVNYMDFYSKKHKTLNNVDENISGIVKRKMEYTCQCCDNTIDMFKCKDGHLNMFCMLSFSPIITNDYLICKGCDATARADVCKDGSLCVFCDLHLVNPD